MSISANELGTFDSTQYFRCTLLYAVTANDARRRIMEAMKMGNKWWVEECEDNEGAIYFLFRLNAILNRSIAVAESRDREAIIKAWEALENL